MWDEVSPLAPPDNIQIAKIPDEIGASIGWSYIDGQFVEPPQPERPSDQPTTTGSQTL